jgi:LCP family protein required for cell wall assembly
VKEKQEPMTTPPLDTDQANTLQASDHEAAPVTKAANPVANMDPVSRPQSTISTHGYQPDGTYAGPEPSYCAPQKPLQRLLNILLWSGIFVGTAATSAVVGASVALMVPLPDFMGHEPSRPFGLGELWQSGFRYQVTRPVNILVMGIDEVPDVNQHSEEIFTGRTDTLLLVRVNPQDGTANVMSIPRDTRVQIPGYGMDKINQANVEGGPDLVAQTIGYNLGNIQIDRYVRVSTGAFREIVDLVGGIEVNVPKRMEYTDHTQKLYIDLYPGWQTLNGDQAEQFARYRKDANGDIGRVQRQQMLLKALRARLTNPTVIPKLPQVVRVVQRYLDTNLSLEEMLALANFSLELEASDLHMVMLPGRFSGATEYNASYWLPDWEASAPIIQNFFQTNSVGVYADNNVTYISDLRIAVQNASGENHLATQVAAHLRDSGFSNIYVIADWPDTTRATEIIAQRGDLESAAVVESVLGTGQVVAESTGDLESDITIRIGQDWDDQIFTQDGNDEYAPAVE